MCVRLHTGANRIPQCGTRTQSHSAATESTAGNIHITYYWGKYGANTANIEYMGVIADRSRSFCRFPDQQTSGKPLDTMVQALDREHRTFDGRQLM